MTYVEINVFSIIVLLFIYFNVYLPAEKLLIEQKLFLGLLKSNVLLLVLDSAMWLLDSKTFFLAREANLFVSTLYYVANPIPCYLWVLYGDYLINGDGRRIKKMWLPFLIPVGVNAVFAVLSIYGNYSFYIGPDNVYHRGRYFPLMAILCGLYLFYALLYIATNRKKLAKNAFLPVLAFAFPPYIAAVLQTLFYGISLVWNCMAISLLIVFINIQNRQLYTDYLTGLCNRKQLDSFLRERKRCPPGSPLLGGIMIDLNSFKAINDVYGHVAGDEALAYTGKILKKSFRRDDLVARYGGDEFVVITQEADPSCLSKMVERLKKNAQKFNQTGTAPYEISFSVGFDVFDCAAGRPVMDFLNHIDSLMYEDKKSQKKLRQA